MLYLHCGWVRTGTTSLQSAIVEHREELATAGIVYPEWWRPDGITDHHGLIDLLGMRKEERQLELARFQERLHSISDRSVVLSSESLTHWVVDGKRDAMASLLAAAQTTMPVTCIWTLRNVVDIARSLYHRFGLVRPGTPLSPTEAIDRLIRDPNWPEDMFAGLRRMEDTADETVYLEYRRNGSHNRELLRVMNFPPALSAAIERHLNEEPRLNGRLTQKGAVAILRCDELSARAGVSMSRDALVELFYRGGFQFDDDRPCDLFDVGATEELHEQALVAARNSDFRPYLEFFGDERPEQSAPTAIDPGVLSDEDLDRLVACLQPVQSLS